MTIIKLVHRVRFGPRSTKALLKTVLPCLFSLLPSPDDVTRATSRQINRRKQIVAAIVIEPYSHTV